MTCACTGAWVIILGMVVVDRSSSLAGARLNDSEIGNGYKKRLAH